MARSSKTLPDSDVALRALLAEVYADVMHLARSTYATEGMAREWYTGIVAEKLKSRVRVFSGYVSANALAEMLKAKPELAFDHHARIRTTITGLVIRHLTHGEGAGEFVDTVIRCESVNIVTTAENYALRKHEGDPVAAGVVLSHWDELLRGQRELVFSKKLKRGRVANFGDFALEGCATGIAARDAD